MTRPIILILASCGLWLASTSPAAARLIFFDTFDEPGATRNNDANDPLDLPFFARGSAGHTIQSDSVLGPAGNNALQFVPPFPGGVAMGSFDNDLSDNAPATGDAANSGNVQLGTTVGDRLRLSFDFRYLVTPDDDVTNGWAFGLHADPQGPVTSDATGPATNNAVGYVVQVPFGPGAPGTVVLGQEVGGGGDMLTGGDVQSLGTGLARIGDNGAHSFMLELIRQAGGVELNFFYDDVLNATAFDATSPYTSFNLAGFRSAQQPTWRVDNVRLEEVLVPEPATLPLVGLTCLAAWFIRRRAVRR